jgi:hypothetical protein
MRHEITKADNYLLVLDYKDVQPGDSFLLDFDHPSGRIRRCDRVCDDGKEDLLMIDPVGFGFLYRRECKRISAHRPFNGAPYLDDVDVLPSIGEIDDVEQLAILKYPVIMSPNGRTLAGGHYDIDVNFSERSAYKHGYNKSREKYEFTEEDIRKAFCDGQFDGMMGVTNNCPVSNVDTYIQSLHQPKLPVAFESEMNNPMFALSIEPKRITNAEGRTEWVGKYIYE